METSKRRRFDKANLREYLPSKKKKKILTSYQNGAVLAKIRVSPLTKMAPFRVGVKPKTLPPWIRLDRTTFRLNLAVRPPPCKKIPTVH